MRKKEEEKMLKKQLFEFCEGFLEDRIKVLQDAIADSRRSSQEDTKSSAGDKFETGREMIQGEIEQNSRQLAEALKLKQLLGPLSDLKTAGLVRPGSLVYTTEGVFYIAIPAGLHQINGQQYVLVSSSSPIGVQLLGKKTGESFSFNGRAYTVTEIF